MQQLFHKMNQCQDDPRSRYALDQLAHAVSHSSDGVQLLVIFPHLADQVLEMTLTEVRFTAAMRNPCSGCARAMRLLLHNVSKCSLWLSLEDARQPLQDLHHPSGGDDVDDAVDDEEGRQIDPPLAHAHYRQADLTQDVASSERRLELLLRGIQKSAPKDTVAVLDEAGLLYPLPWEQDSNRFQVADRDPLPCCGYTPFRLTNSATSSSMVQFICDEDAGTLRVLCSMLATQTLSCGVVLLSLADNYKNLFFFSFFLIPKTRF